VCVACSGQGEAHGDIGCIFLVGSEGHQAGSFDGVPAGCLWVEEGSQVDRGAHARHAHPQCTACEWVHSSYQQASGITLNLHARGMEVSNLGYHRIFVGTQDIMGYSKDILGDMFIFLRIYV
jgi:hypothetical protein